MNLQVAEKARGLIFDFDGTLGDTLPIHYRSWQETARQFRFEITKDFFLGLVGTSSATIIRKINQQQNLRLDIEPVVRFKNNVYVKYADRIRLFQPVLHLVQTYHDKLPIALGTSECREIAAINIKATGLDRFFKIIVTADDVPNPKPEPDIFLRCAALMGIVPQFCQVFEDGAPGFVAVQRAGMILTDVRPFVQESRSA